MTKERWKQLTEKQQWDILVTLRGPDMRGGEVLKWFTSAVVRADMKPIVKANGGSATTNERLGAVVIPDAESNLMKRMSNFDATHFIEHVKDAAQIIGLPIVTIPANLYWDAVGTQSVSAALDTMIRGIPAGSTRDLLKSHYDQIRGAW